MRELIDEDSESASEFAKKCGKRAEREDRASAFWQRDRNLSVMHGLGVAFKTSIFENVRYNM